MRIFFGVLSLLVVLAIVGSIGKKQLQALNGDTARRMSTATGEPGSERRDGATAGIPGAVPGTMATDHSSQTVPQISQNIQQQIRNDTERALQQGADRNARAAP